MTGHTAWVLPSGYVQETVRLGDVVSLIVDGSTSVGHVMDGFVGKDGVPRLLVRLEETLGEVWAIPAPPHGREVLEV
jgi:hypothetical protein